VGEKEHSTTTRRMTIYKIVKARPKRVTAERRIPFGKQQPGRKETGARKRRHEKGSGSTGRGVTKRYQAKPVTIRKYGDRGETHKKNKITQCGCKTT